MTTTMINTNVTEVPLRDAVKNTVQRYLEQCGNQPPTNLYDLVLEQVEEPMLSFLMEKTRYNQSEVTRILGLARGTIRKKLKQYGFIDTKT